MICSHWTAIFVLAVVIFFKIIIFSKIIYLFILWQRGREGEREGEKHPCVVASRVPPTREPGPQPRYVCALTGNRTGDPVVLRLALNPLSHTRQGSSQLFSISLIY